MNKVDPISEWIIDILTWRFRLVADVQIALLLSLSQPDLCATSVLASLVRRNLISQVRLHLPILDLRKPLFVFDPEHESQPAFGKLSWMCKKRFDATNQFSQKVFFATEKAIRYFGGSGGRIRQPFQVLHDLGTASAYIGRCAFLPTRNEQWIGEDALRLFHRHLGLTKVPDAAELDFQNDLSTVIEFCGKDYSSRYLKRFHNHWRAKQMRYELW